MTDRYNAKTTTKTSKQIEHDKLAKQMKAYEKHNKVKYIKPGVTGIGKKFRKKVII